MTRAPHLMVVPPGADVPADAVWRRVRAEAEEALAAAPALAPLFEDAILDQADFESALAYRIASRLKNDTVGLPALTGAFARAHQHAPAIGQAMRADILAVLERDPACGRLIEPFLYFKGFHAIQTHRLAHFLWTGGETDFALYLQSRSSEVFQTDIHPAALIGQGVFLDHATGLVVGATAVIEDEVSMLQAVTLGGTGKERGDRHPKIRRGALIGAGAKVLGNIEVGEGARVAAGSVVLAPVAAHTTVAGIPARPTGMPTPKDPAHCMDQCVRAAAYDAFTYTI